MEAPRATRAGINNALARRQDLTPKDLREFLEIDASELARIRAMREALSSEAVATAVNEGKVSYGMVKPQRQGPQNTIEAEGPDETIAQEVIEAIKPPLYVGFEQAIWIPQTQAERFYAHLPQHVLNRVAGFMSSGASTGLFLETESSGAVEEWRRQMGPTRAHNMPETEADSIRYRFRTRQGVENNVAHGSDSIESVRNELIFFAEMLGVLVD